MASTNWDTDRKRRRPPAWDPPKLLLVIVSGLHIVVGTSGVVGVVVDGGVWLLGSSIWLRQPGRNRKGGKREKSNREYSSKVLSSKDLHYICMGIFVKGQYRWNELQNARIRGDS